MDNLADFAGLGHSADEGDQVLTLKFLPYKEEHQVHQAEARAKWLFVKRTARSRPIDSFRVTDDLTFPAMLGGARGF
jgi:hypothetical protein